MQFARDVFLVTLRRLPPKTVVALTQTSAPRLPAPSTASSVKGRSIAGPRCGQENLGSQQPVVVLPNEFTFRFNRRGVPMAAFQTVLGLIGERQGPTYAGLYGVAKGGDE